MGIGNIEVEIKKIVAIRTIEYKVIKKESRNEKEEEDVMLSMNLIRILMKSRNRNMS